MIIIEKPYQICDKIELDYKYGEVVDIGLVQTIIVTPDDSRVAIPNYSVLTRSVSSANAGPAEMMVVTDLFLSYRGDITGAVRLLKKRLSRPGMFTSLVHGRLRSSLRITPSIGD